MKKWALFSFFILSAALTTKWLLEYQKYEQVNASTKVNRKWQGHIKRSQEEKPERLEKISKEDKMYLPTEKKHRLPSSLESTNQVTQTRRKIIGHKQILPQELTLINNPRHDWEDVFVRKMLDTQAPKTKMFIQHTGPALIVNKTRARAVEEVFVTFKKENQGVSSYMAWVDSETGSIVRTWDQTHNHNFRQKASPLTPTGQL